MRDFIADKELSDHQPLQESDTLSGSIDATNDDEHEENKKKRSYKKERLYGWMVRSPGFALWKKARHILG